MCNKKNADHEGENLLDYDLKPLLVDIDDELLPEVDFDSLLIPIEGGSGSEG
jgi:hypothetical protein